MAPTKASDTIKAATVTPKKMPSTASTIPPTTAPIASPQLRGGRITTTRYKATKLWTLLTESIRVQATAYTCEDKFRESTPDSSSLHDDIKTALRWYFEWQQITTTTPSSFLLNIKNWTKLFKLVLAESQTAVFSGSDPFDPTTRRLIQLLMARLSMSDPGILFKSEIDNKFLLPPNNMTTAWRAAITVLGTHYVDRSMVKKTSSAAVAKKPTQAPASSDTPVPAVVKSIPEVSSPVEHLSTPTLPGGSNKTPRNDFFKTRSAKGQKTRFEESPDLQFKARYDLQLRFQTGDNTIEELPKAIKKWYLHIRQSYDDTIVLSPWWNNSMAPPISRNSEWPDHLKELNDYFYGCNTSNSWGNIVYLKIHLSLTKDPRGLTSIFPHDLAQWYKQMNWSCYKKPLITSDYPVPIGYLVYTGNFTDEDALQVLNNQALKAANYTEEIGLKLRSKPGFKPGGDFFPKWRESGGQWFNQPWKRIYVDTDRHNSRSATQIMMDLWNKSSTRPGQYRCRFVPLDSALTITAIGRDKGVQASNKHEFVVRSKLYEVEIGNVLFLDKVDTSSGMTLRRFLMDMVHSVSGKTLLHSVDQSNARNVDRGKTILCTCFADHLTELQGLTSVLAAMVAVRINADCLNWFTLIGIEQSKSVLYDSSGKTFSCQDDTIHDMLLDEDMDGVTHVELENMSSEPSTQKHSLLDTDDLSHNTFGTEFGSVKKKRRTDSSSVTSSLATNSTGGSVSTTTKKAFAIREEALVSKNTDLEEQVTQQRLEQEQLRAQLEKFEIMILSQQENKHEKHQESNQPVANPPESVVSPGKAREQPSPSHASHAIPEAVVSPGDDGLNG